MLLGLTSLIGVIVILDVGFRQAQKKFAAQEIEQLRNRRKEWNREIKKRRYLGVKKS